MKSQVITIMAAVMLLLSLATAVPTMITSTSAQLSSPPSSSQQQSTTVDSNRIFESEEDGFRLQIPQGWVIQDEDIITAPVDPIIETIAMLCLENEALPDVGGDYNCEAASLTDSILINRFPDLQSRPEFQNESATDSTIIPTTDDLVALWIQELQNEGTSQIRIENTTDIDEFTKTVDMTYLYVETAGTALPFDDFTYEVKNTGMYVLSQDRNTGYTISNSLAIPNVLSKVAISGI
jgi:hypothetical protein